MDIIRLHEISVELLSPSHQDNAANSSISAQIVIEHTIFVQTLPVACSDVSKGCVWKLTFKCDIPHVGRPLSIVILRANSRSVTRVLGTVNIERDEILAKAQHEEFLELSPQFHTVDDEGPLFGLSAKFSVSPLIQQSLVHPNRIQAMFDEICSSEELSLNPETIPSRVEEMSVSSEAGESINSLKISVMHQGILLLQSDEQEKARLLYMLGNICFRHHESREIDVMHRAIDLYNDAVQEATCSSAFELVYWDYLGLSLWHRFQRIGDIKDIEISVQVFEDVVMLTPDDDPYKALRLTNLGISLQTRFEQLGDPADLNRSVQVADDAVTLTQDGHSDKASRLKTLGDLLQTRFEQLGDLADLNRSIQVKDDAVVLMSDNDLNKPSLLNNLGSSLQTRFEKLGDLADLNRSVQVKYDAVTLTQDGHSDKASRLKTLGDLLETRFEQLGDLADLNRSIQVKDDAVVLMPDDHPNKPSLLNNLGSLLQTRFEKLEDLADLNRSVQAKDDAVMLTPDSHSNKLSWLNNLGSSLWIRFERLGDLADLSRSLEVMDDVVRLAPDGHPDKPSWLNNLGISLQTRFEQLGDLADLNRCVQVADIAVMLTPDGHPDKPSFLSTLGVSLQARFERSGDLADMNRSVQVKDDAVMLTADEHPDKPAWLKNLATSLRIRFERLGDLTDLHRSVEVADDAVKLTPDGHRDKPALLITLANSLVAYFERLGDLSALNRAIQVIDNTIMLTPEGHHNMSLQLNSLGTSLWMRFQQLGDLGDLERSIQVMDNAVRLTPDGHSRKPLQLNNLGNSLQARFEQLGELADLNRSIQAKHDAITLTPDGHPTKPSLLNTLGKSLQTRFDRLGDLADLIRSVQVTDIAVMLTPDDHPDKPSQLNNLGISLQTCFEQLGDLSDLKRSVQVADNAVMLTPDGHPARPSRLNTLANLLLTQSEKTGNVADLSKSVQVADDAIILIPNGHPDKPSLLTTLANSLWTRFKQLRDLADLNRSVQVADDAIKLTPDSHPDKPSWLYNLGLFLQTRFQEYHDPEDLDAASSSFHAAANSITGSAHIKFMAARSWVHLAHHHFPDQALESSIAAMNLIPQITSLGLSIDDRHHRITKAGTVARDAAATAITAVNYATAVEWLEQGRSVIWTQVLQLRSPLDELDEVHPEFAARFQFLSSQLEGPTSRKNIQSFQQIIPQIDYHQLAHEREELLSKIRGLPGFERFLLPKLLPQLVPAAVGGPIVILNVSEARCDALVLLPRHENVLHIPLKDLTLKDLTVWRDGLLSIQRTGSWAIKYTERLKAVRMPDHGIVLNREQGLVYILEKLWCYITKPILDAIPTTETSVRRIWWCPTGPLTFLPIHAAGVYPEGPKLSDFVVSSYTPTLTALLDRSQFHIRPTEEHQLLTVALPKESQPPLPGTGKEIECVAKHAEKFRILSLLDSQATAEQVSKAMESSSYVHFACHGTQDSINPTESCLWLAGDSKLTILEIIKLSLKHAELAFLSACETATGDEELEDEAVHLAAGMLLAGYRGVIATMWTIDDEFTAKLADETYRLLFKEYGGDSTRAAEALHLAIKKVREEQEAKGQGSLFHWVPFLHMGI